MPVCALHFVSTLNVDQKKTYTKSHKDAKIDHHPSLNQLTAKKQSLLIKGGLVIRQTQQLIRQLMSQSGMYVSKSHLEHFGFHL